MKLQVIVSASEVVSDLINDILPNKTSLTIKFYFTSANCKHR